MYRGKFSTNVRIGIGFVNIAGLNQIYFVTVLANEIPRYTAFRSE